MAATNNETQRKNKAYRSQNNEINLNGEFLSSIEEEIVMIDGTVRPEMAVIDAHPLLTVDELLPPQFIEQNTAASDAKAFFAPHEVSLRADLLTLPSTVDDYIDYSTPFDDLTGMLEAAVKYRID